MPFKFLKQTKNYLRHGFLEFIHKEKKSTPSKSANTLEKTTIFNIKQVEENIVKNTYSAAEERTYNDRRLKALNTDETILEDKDSPYPDYNINAVIGHHKMHACSAPHKEGRGNAKPFYEQILFNANPTKRIKKFIIPAKSSEMETDHTFHYATFSARSSANGYQRQCVLMGGKYYVDTRQLPEIEDRLRTHLAGVWKESIFVKDGGIIFNEALITVSVDTDKKALVLKSKEGNAELMTIPYLDTEKEFDVVTPVKKQFFHEYWNPNFEDVFEGYNISNYDSSWVSTHIQKHTTTIVNPANQSETITVYSFPKWPDYGVLQFDESDIHALYEIYQLDEPIEQWEMSAIHCDGGVGRTGVLVFAVELYLHYEEFLKAKTPEAKNTVIETLLGELRLKRPGLVQTNKQAEMAVKLAGDFYRIKLEKLYKIMRALGVEHRVAMDFLDDPSSYKNRNAIIKAFNEKNINLNGNPEITSKDIGLLKQFLQEHTTKLDFGASKINASALRLTNQLEGTRLSQDDFLVPFEQRLFDLRLDFLEQQLSKHASSKDKELSTIRKEIKSLREKKPGKGENIGDYVFEKSLKEKQAELKESMDQLIQLEKSFGVKTNDKQYSANMQRLHDKAKNTALQVHNESKNISKAFERGVADFRQDLTNYGEMRDISLSHYIQLEMFAHELYLCQSKLPNTDTLGSYSYSGKELPCNKETYIAVSERVKVLEKKFSDLESKISHMDPREFSKQLHELNEELGGIYKALELPQFAFEHLRSAYGRLAKEASSPEEASQLLSEYRDKMNHYESFPFYNVQSLSLIQNFLKERINFLDSVIPDTDPQKQLIINNLQQRVDKLSKDFDTVSIFSAAEAISTALESKAWRDGDEAQPRLFSQNNLVLLGFGNKKIGEMMQEEKTFMENRQLQQQQRAADKPTASSENKYIRPLAPQ